MGLPVATVISVDIAKFIVTGFKMIPLRQRKRKRIKGRYRRKRREEFDELLYYITYLAETMLSFLKRKYRKEIKARKFLQSPNFHNLCPIKFKCVMGIYYCDVQRHRYSGSSAKDGSRDKR